MERSDEKIRLQTELVSRGESDPSPKRMSDAGTEEMDLANVMRLSNFANFRDTELKELSSSKTLSRELSNDDSKKPIVKSGPFRLGR